MLDPQTSLLHRLLLRREALLLSNSGGQNDSLLAVLDAQIASLEGLEHEDKEK
jgi:hypothetical protein